MSTALQQGPIELRCGQCWINQYRRIQPYKENLVGTLHQSDGEVFFTEHERVAPDGQNDHRYPVSYQPAKDTPRPEDWLLLSAHRGKEANLVQAGLARANYYDYRPRRPLRKVQVGIDGIQTRCRRGHNLGVTTEQLEQMLHQPMPYPGGTYLPGLKA